MVQLRRSAQLDIVGRDSRSRRTASGPLESITIERPNPETLERVPLFAALSREEVDEIITAATLQTFEPDEVILRQGMISQNLWVLLEGRCEVVKDVAFGGRGTGFR